VNERGRGDGRSLIGRSLERRDAREGGGGPGPHGAKGVAEGSIITVAPALANAVFAATGVRLRDLSLTPERLWRALRDAESRSPKRETGR